MVNYSNPYPTPVPFRPGQSVDWSGEITPPVPRQTRPASDTGLGGMAADQGTAPDRTPGTTESFLGGGNVVTGGTGGGSWLAGGLSGLAPGEGNRPQPGQGNGGMETDRLGSLVPGGGPAEGNGQGNTAGWPDIENHLPEEVVEAPTTMDEVYRGSLKALLSRNIGNYVVATFLIGTQTTVAWEGILYDVGNDYIAIYQSGRDQYIVSDLYSLKYVEFYDTRRRELCDAVLQQRSWPEHA